MKYLAIIFTLYISVSSVYSQTANETKVEASFNNSMDFETLVDIKNKMADLGITLDYLELEFKENGKLKSISFNVDCNDGFAGSASASFNRKDYDIGFFRDYSKNAKVPFRTGTMKK